MNFADNFLNFCIILNSAGLFTIAGIIAALLTYYFVHKRRVCIITYRSGMSEYKGEKKKPSNRLIYGIFNKSLSGVHILEICLLIGEETIHFWPQGKHKNDGIYLRSKERYLFISGDVSNKMLKGKQIVQIKFADGSCELIKMKSQKMYMISAMQISIDSEVQQKQQAGSKLPTGEDNENSTLGRSE